MMLFDNAVAMVTVQQYIQENYVYYGLKQGQITQNIDNKYVLKLIHLVAQCSKITNTVLFL